jgi:hypothetical protein
MQQAINGPILPPANTSSEIIRVPFQGDEILTVDQQGKPHVILRPALEQLGVDYSTQLQRLKTRTWAAVGHCPTQDQYRDMVTVDVRTFLMLLATINETRVAKTIRPKLIAYQAEVADAIEQYWTKGGALNPRATDDQLDQIIRHAQGQMRVLQLAQGIVDPAWLEAKARHTAARALGEEPEIDPSQRPLTTGEYLEDKGYSGATLRSLSTKFGKRVKALYVEHYGEEPQSVDRFIGGALRKVKGYTEAHRSLFDRALVEVNGSTAATS